MVKLVNGRGQLGQALEKALRSMAVPADVLLYHTWNHMDKSPETQAVELSKFEAFVDENSEKRIAFVSAIHEKFNPYGVAKMAAELYLWQHCKLGQVFRLPYLVGKGLAQRIKDGEQYRSGSVEVGTMQWAAWNIINSLNSEFDRLKVFHGGFVDASMMQALIEFGKR
jgi:hypothetical protein